MRWLATVGIGSAFSGIALLLYYALSIYVETNGYDLFTISILLFVVPTLVGLIALALAAVWDL